MDVIIQIVYLLIALVVYFIPTIIANNKDHYAFKKVFVLNILLGWTGLGWLAMLIWALVPDICQRIKR